MAVRAKLAKARLMFLNENVKKSGKNMHLEFKYFELEDIVPSVTQIFAEVGLVSNTQFTNDAATMTVYDTDDDTSEGIMFSLPWREAPTIESNAGKQVTNPMQALGSSTTYMRRYLYMMAMDIVEHDDIDAALGADESAANEEPTPAPKKKEKKQKPPATPADRKAAKKELTKADGNATEEQITSLKAVCKTLMDKDEEQEEFVQQIALKTEGFTKIAASACDELIKNLEEMVAAYNG